jgi:hypothetical protein
MTRRPVLLAAVAVLSAAAACSDSPTRPSAPLDRQFTLAPGEAARIAGTSVRVRFERVDGDSRCPADALCVLGGDAVVRIAVENDGPGRSYALHTGTMAPVRHDDLTIALVELAPYPFSARTIAPDEYRATLRVTR